MLEVVTESSALLFAAAPRTGKAQSHHLEKKTHFSSNCNHIYLPRLYLSLSLSFVVELFLGVPRDNHCFSQRDWLTDWRKDSKPDRMWKANNFTWKRLAHTCATWAHTLVAPLIFNGTVWARDVVRLASVTELGGGGNDPIVIQALPLSPLPSLLTALWALTPRAPISPSCSGVPSWEKVDGYLEQEILLPSVELQGAAPPEAAIVSSIQVLTWQIRTS